MRWPTPLTPIIIAKLIGGGGGGGTVTAAAVLSAMEAMTASQASDALDAIDGEPQKLIVTVTESGGVYSADKTFAEIEAAIAAKKTVELNEDILVSILMLYEPGDYAIFYTLAFDGAGGINVLKYYVESDDSWSVETENFKSAPSRFVDLSSTSITLASAADNTIYSYGELTALTISAIANPGEFSITFTSGATATVLTVPNSMIMPDGFAVEANTRYEINCSNGYALVASWPVS